MSDEWDGKVVMSAPGGPIVEMSLGDLLARKDAEIERLRAEIEQLRAGIQSLAESLRASLDAAIRQRDEARAENERLREALRWYADQRNHFPVEHRRPGDPDPAVIFVEEPPIMLDGGERARRALEGKP